MIKVFTSVYLVESTASALDAMEQALVQEPVPAQAGGRQMVELHVELKAPQSRTSVNELKSNNAGGR